MSDGISKISIKLRELRTRAGYSLLDMAKIMGAKHKSNYQYFETKAFKGNCLPTDLIRKIRPSLIKKGIPAKEIDNLSYLCLAGTDNDPLNHEVLIMCFENVEEAEELIGHNMENEEKAQLVDSIYRQCLYELELYGKTDMDGRRAANMLMDLHEKNN